MSENIKMEDLEEKVLASDTTETTEETEETVENTETDVTEQNPLKIELEKVKSKNEGRSELEKAIFKRNQIDKHIRELKGDTDEDTDLDNDEDTPVTIGMLKKMQSETATKTALQLADDISDEVEKELVKYHIENTIRSTGNPAEDLKLSRAIVNSVKNTQIAEMVANKSTAKTHSNSSSAPANHTEKVELTAEEILFTRPPFNMTPEQVLKARK